ncbi:hypothetical protein M2146_002504 [Lachnospiraceae bacterium PF1-22]
MNQCAIDVVKNQLAVKANQFKVAEKQAVIERKSKENIEMYRDISKIYMDLFVHLECQKQ